MKTQGRLGGARTSDGDGNIDVDIALDFVLQLEVIQAIPPEESSGARLNFEKREPSEREKALASLKARVVQIGMNGTRAGFKFAEAMFEEFPELKKA